jgi:hypothetical protein
MTDTADVLSALVARTDSQDWDGLRRLLADDATVHYVHDGQDFDADGYVAYNRDYPGRWRLRLDDLVVDGERGASRTRVTDGVTTYCVAGFATVRGGLVARLVEVWSSEVVAG